MVTRELLQYIREQRGLGVGEEEVKRVLLANGWIAKDVADALGLITPRREIPVSSADDGSTSASPPAQAVFSARPLVFAPPQESMGKINSSSGVQQRPRNSFYPILTGVVVLLLATGGVFYLYYFFGQGVGLGQAAVVGRMFTALGQVQSLEHIGELRLEPADRSGAGGTTIVNFSGVYDVSGGESKSAWAFDLQVDATPIFGAEALTLHGQKLYFKLGRSLGWLGIVELDPLTNQWLEIDLGSATRATASEASSSTAGWFPEVWSLRDWLPPEKTATLKEALVNSPIFSITREYPGEQLVQRPVYRYQFVLNKLELQKFLEKTGLFASGPEPSDDELRPREELLRAIVSLGGEVWIGREDFLPYKLSLELLVVNEEVDGPPERIRLTLDLWLSGYNQPVVIEAPATAKPLDEVLSRLVAELLTPSSGDELEIQATTPE